MFTNTVVWLEYESIQADMVDHIFAIVEESVCDFTNANRQRYSLSGGCI